MGPHRDEILTGSAISEDVAAARGYETLTDTPENRTRLRELGIPSFAWRDRSAWPGLLVPMYGVTSETDSVQWKPATPQANSAGRTLKYASPSGQANRIDVPAFTRARLDSPGTELWVTEGIKKVDSLVSQGLAAIGITGVFNWKSAYGAWGLWEDIPLKGRTVVITFDADALTKDQVRQAMLRFGTWLKDAKRAVPKYLIVPGEVDGQAVKGVDDYFAADGTVQGLAAVATDVPPRKDADARFTDSYLAAEVAAELFDGRFCWTPGMGWLRWTRTVWETAGEEDALEAVRQYAIDRYEGAVREQRNGGDRADVEGWHKTLTVGRLSAVVKLARGIVKVDDDALDADRDLLNVRNGIVDLTTGKLHPHDPGQFMTRIAGVDYDPDATSTAWGQVLSAMPDDVRDWMQARMGQAATGHRNEDDVVPILQGSGSNAKTTFTEGISQALGTYHTLVPDALLLGSAQRDESMTLRGSRYALIEETPKAASLNSTMLKKVTSPTMTGHHLYARETTWQTTHSLFVTTNYRPVVTETDGGTWRRLALVTFPYRYVDGTPDPSKGERRKDRALRGRIESGDPEILRAALRWIVDGARAWYDADKVLPTAPETVVRDTAKWRMETDLVMAYWDERLEPDPGTYVIASDLFADFNEWASSRNYHERTERGFTPKFESHDVTVQHRVTRKDRMRPTASGMSRPERTLADELPGSHRAPLKPVPNRFTGWIGVRFRSSEEETPVMAVNGHVVAARVADPFAQVQ
ncbi:phage/plasmid primase, P4 family [Streptomyces sp. NPDC001221]